MIRDQNVKLNIVGLSLIFLYIYIIAACQSRVPSGHALQLVLKQACLQKDVPMILTLTPHQVPGCCADMPGSQANKLSSSVVEAFKTQPIHDKKPIESVWEVMIMCC